MGGKVLAELMGGDLVTKGGRTGANGVRMPMHEVGGQKKGFGRIIGSPSF